MKARTETTKEAQDKMWTLVLTSRPTVWPGMVPDGKNGDGDHTRVWLAASVGWPEAIRLGRGLGV